MAQELGAITENVALLAVLGPALEPVTDNPIPRSLFGNFDPDRHRTLSLQQEQQLAEAFAVLLVHTDDTGAVGAVCVEETRKPVGLIVKTAVNSGSQDGRIKIFHSVMRALNALSPTGWLTDILQFLCVTYLQNHVVSSERNCWKSWLQHADHEFSAVSVLDTLCAHESPIRRRSYQNCRMP